MAIYTGVADANGDFNIPFSTNYTGGQKVTVTAEKDSATKSIELYAPSEPSGGGVIQFDGSLTSFPTNIGGVKITGISGSIAANAFNAATTGTLWRSATSLELGYGVTLVSNDSFSSWVYAEELILPNSLLTIESGAFNGWSTLLDLIMPNSVTSLGMSCFNWCTKLKNISLSTSLTTIPVNAFANNQSLEAIYLPDSITTVQNQAFLGCGKVKSLRIGSNCVSIGGWAFNGMVNCEEIICERLSPPTLDDGTSFENLKSTCIIKVPSASVTAYQSAPWWSAFAARIQAI